MAQEEEMCLVSKTDTKTPPKETLAGSCMSAAVQAMSLPNNLPGHRQHLGPRKDCCEAKNAALKRLEEAGKEKHTAKEAKQQTRKLDDVSAYKPKAIGDFVAFCKEEKVCMLTLPASPCMCALLLSCSVLS